MKVLTSVVKYLAFYDNFPLFPFLRVCTLMFPVLCTLNLSSWHYASKDFLFSFTCNIIFTVCNYPPRQARAHTHFLHGVTSRRVVQETGNVLHNKVNLSGKYYLKIVELFSVLQSWIKHLRRFGIKCQQKSKTFFDIPQEQFLFFRIASFSSPARRWVYSV